jgi:hypothetical protein
VRAREQFELIDQRERRERRDPRQRDREAKPRRKLGYKILYFLSASVIVVIWVYAFRSYFEQYDSLHPEITWALPWVQVDSISADGVFLWNETTLIAPRAGAVSFPRGRGPVRVAKGAVVARVGSGSSISDVRTQQEGYFVAGTDGMEGKWRYARLWPGQDELPEASPVKLLGDGVSVKKGDAVGKLIDQPQDLRFIGYADMTPNFEKNLASNGVMVKMDSLDTPSHAQVRVFERVGHRVKIYLTMPWFPPEATLSRNYDLIIEAESMTGVSIPESAVTIRDGSRGAFVLTGSEAVFTKVEGVSTGDSKFLVTKGMKLGDAVIVNGHSARDGRVKLW